MPEAFSEKFYVTMTGEQIVAEFARHVEHLQVQIKNMRALDETLNQLSQQRSHAQPHAMLIPGNRGPRESAERVEQRIANLQRMAMFIDKTVTFRLGINDLVVLGLFRDPDSYQGYGPLGMTPDLYA